MYKVYYQFEGPQINQPVIPPPTDGQANLGTSVPAFILNYLPQTQVAGPVASTLGTTFELLSPFGVTFNMYCRSGESNMYEIAIGKIAGMSAGASLTILTQ
tara:strand:- start:120 stop:422 length:303 start_codon:yes stop_codon:yes gene_type:complete